MLGNTGLRRPRRWRGACSAATRSRRRSRATPLVSGPDVLRRSVSRSAPRSATRAGRRARRAVRAFVTRNPPLLAVIAGLLAPDALAPDVLVDRRARRSSTRSSRSPSSSLGVTLGGEAEEGVLRVPAAAHRAASRSPSGCGSCSSPALLVLALSPALPCARPPDAYSVQAAMPAAAINAIVVAHVYGLDLRLGRRRDRVEHDDRRASPAWARRRRVCCDRRARPRPAGEPRRGARRRRGGRGHRPRPARPARRHPRRRRGDRRPAGRQGPRAAHLRRRRRAA